MFGFLQNKYSIDIEKLFWFCPYINILIFLFYNINDVQTPSITFMESFVGKNPLIVYLVNFTGILFYSSFCKKFSYIFNIINPVVRMLIIIISENTLYILMLHMLFLILQTCFLLIFLMIQEV